MLQGFPLYLQACLPVGREINTTQLKPLPTGRQVAVLISIVIRLEWPFYFYTNVFGLFS
jgi:hypothetical protein